MDYELFWISGSPYAWRVQLAFEYKGVPYASHRLDSAKRENRSPAFFAFNPRGKVPVLRAGDAALYESVATIAFLDRSHPAVPLFGQRDPRRRVRPKADPHGRTARSPPAAGLTAGLECDSWGPRRLSWRRSAPPPRVPAGGKSLAIGDGQHGLGRVDDEHGE